MIKPPEIKKKAATVGVRDQQIEKDYILSWILKGISQHESLAKAIVFIGGTVLKKVYFEDYRFSEDLDFTLMDDNVSNEQMFIWFGEVFETIKEEANIPLGIVEDNEHADGGINFYIGYTGPLGGQGNNKRVKVDISRSERLEYTPVMKNVITGYTDLEEYQLLCYPLEEVLVEKMRCVMQRMEARNFYDIWFLLEVHKLDAAFQMKEFAAKCEQKGVNHLDFPRKLLERLPQYKQRWKSSMGDQIQDLPDFEKVERDVQRHLRRLKL